MFGSATYTRSTKKPATESSVFSGDPSADYIIDIEDGGSQGADGSVVVNGVVILSPRSGQDVAPRHVHRSIQLLAQNHLDVRLTGKPGSTLTIFILGGAKEIGESGGTVTAPGGDVRLTVPSGALTTPSEIQIVRLTEFSPPEVFPLGPQGLAWRLQPEGLQFALPVSVRIVVSSLGTTPPDFLSTDLLFAHFAADGSLSEIREPHSAEFGSIAEFEVNHFSVVFPFFWAGGHTSSDRHWRVFGFKWGISTLKWYVQPPTSTTILTVPEINAALSQWQRISNVRFEQTLTRGNANIVFIEEGNISRGIIPQSNCLALGPGYGQTCYPFLAYLGAPTLGTSEQVTIHMASNDLSVSESDIRSSLLHEIGHSVGIAHSPLNFWSALASPAANAPVMNNEPDYFPLSLRPADVDAMQYLYGPPPVAATFTALVAGGEHTCKLTTGGAAYCWGSNNAGQLGDGSTTNRLTPRAVAGGRTFTSLGVGFRHTCGLTAGGTAYCWGDNFFGQLGDGTKTTRLTPTLVLGGIAFTSIAVGMNLSCGLTSAGAAYCWGSNQFGELGDGTEVYGLTPTAVAGGHTFISLAPGNLHSCGLVTGGMAYCWGWNGDGQLGDGTTTRRLTPTAVAGGRTFTRLGLGLRHSCGLLSGGAAYCWGHNGNSQLGDGTTTNRLTPTSVVGGLTFTSLAAGGYENCGLTSGGAAYCWGTSYWLGVRPMPTLVTGGLTFSSITVGNLDFVCGLTGGAAGYCWGYNSSGQLGDGTTTNRLTPTAVANP